MPMINGMILSYIAICNEYQLDNWQWWAIVLGGGIYIMSYDKLKNAIITFK